MDHEVTIIDMGIGQPENAILPRTLLRQAAMEALTIPDNRYLQYGPEPGAQSLRDTLAAFLSRHYGRSVLASELLITNGASHGLDLILSRLTRPGDTIVVEAPTYFFGLDVLRGRGVRLVSVPVDEHGLNTDALHDLLRTVAPAFIYTIPVFQNPTGVTMSPARRRRLVELAARFDVPIVADEVYQLVANRDQVPPPMRSHDAARVLSLGSFSKILGPGIRLGWIECDPAYVSLLSDDGVLRSGGGASPMTGVIVETAIRLGLQDEFLTEVRWLYERRRRHAVEELSRLLPPEVRVIYPEGGYYIWLELPSYVDIHAVRQDAQPAGVDFRPGPIFSIDGSFASSLRLCFTYYDEPHLTLGIERLVRVLNAHLSRVAPVRSRMVRSGDPFVRHRPEIVFHHRLVELNQREPPETATESPLLALGRSSDVDPLLPEQVVQARRVLQLRRALVDEGRAEHREEVLAGQRAIVERFLAGRRAHYGEAESQPLPDVRALIDEDRDFFVVIKFMDEAPHLLATLHSLVNQHGIDLGRVVIVAIDNNSTDGSDAIVREMIDANRSAARIVYLNQARPGAGNAARLGVDTSIATVYEMCVADGRWERLQQATIAVSDGDTVYHPEVLATIREIFDESPTVDGVMPFLIYKLTAALRLFHDYVPAYPAALAHAAADAVPTQVTVDLVDLRAHEALPRHGRRLGHDVMVLIGDGGNEISVPLAHVDEHGRRFGVLCDGAGRRGYVLEDRNLVLAEAPVSGFDAALIFLENGGVRRGEKWRWHTVIGHDLFLYWAFRGIGLPVEAVFPDTSDALKAFRVWSFAIGGQHQLRRPGLRIATGSDYQSGRVLQAVGNVVRLAPASAFAETETDRLIKMVRNFLRRQSVFYGETRSPALDRATGLYVHMTRIQGDIERELREQGDAVFERIAFPERVLFPLRWILQNSVRFYAEGAQQREIARDQVWRLMLGDEGVARVERELLTAETVAAITDASYCDRQGLAERLAEEIIARHYPAIMAFYAACIRGFMLAHRVAPEHFEWLLEGLTSSRNAIVEQPEKVDPTAVWDGPEFDIDIARGQVVRLRDVP